MDSSLTKKIVIALIIVILVVVFGEFLSPSASYNLSEHLWQSVLFIIPNILLAIILGFILGMRKYTKTLIIGSLIGSINLVFTLIGFSIFLWLLGITALIIEFYYVSANIANDLRFKNARIILYLILRHIIIYGSIFFLSILSLSRLGPM